MGIKKFSKGAAGFLTGKGFYIALAVCLIGAGSAAWVAVDKTMDAVNEPNVSNVRNEGGNTDWTVQESNEVGKKEPKVPKSSSSSTESTSQQSSSQSQEHTEQSGKQASSSKQEEEPPKAASLQFALPVQGEILLKFSNGELIKNETLGEWRTHDGVDISAGVSQDVLSCADGEVTEIYSDPLWGTCITIEHEGGVTSCYKGLEGETRVSVGDTVKMNDIIGTLGNTNLAEKSEGHLHFEMKRDGKFVDPLTSLSDVK